LHIALASPPRRCAEWLRSCEIIEFHTFRLRVFSYLQAKKSDFPNNFTASPPFRADTLFSLFWRRGCASTGDRGPAQEAQPQQKGK
jgi:hypothetical protein